MTCADLEILLCDYVDGTLDAERKSDLERHLAECQACSELARDVSAAVGFIERVPAVEPPPELMTRILFELPAAHQARAKKPGGLRRLIHDWIQPIMQPRFAMGFAMTILSVSLIARFVGISPRQITLEDLKPRNVWHAVDDRVNRGWQRTVKFYENLRLVYEIQAQLREWTQASRDAQSAAAGDELRPARPAPAQPAQPAPAPARQGTPDPKTRTQR